MTTSVAQSLADKLNELSDPKPWHVGWYFKDLTSGASANRNGDVVVPSASTRKVAILMTALKQVHEGTLRLDQPLEMLAKYQNNTSGTFQHLAPGFTITLKDALTMMIIVSDNTCTGTVSDIVGLDNVQALCNSIGMKGTFHRLGIPQETTDRSPPVETVNATTPNDQGLLLELIVRGMTDAAAAAQLGSTPELCQVAVEIMSWQKLRYRIPFLLPEGTKVASKTGSVTGQYHDVGIVFDGEKPLYILCAYNSGVPAEFEGMNGNAAASMMMARMSRAIWDGLKG
ncbi:MAG: serine hydrolase [Dehalococcoidia bacterium]